jgi:phosphohistidine phosphatase
MKLYLVRHGVAYEHGDPAFPKDDDRTLTPDGRKKFRKAAVGLLEMIDPPAVILTSPLPRTAQTAEILQEVAGNGTRLAVSDGMRPRGSFDRVLNDCMVQINGAGPLGDENEIQRRGIALVGHAPTIGLLGAWLLNSDSARFSLELRKGGVACIDFEGIPEAGRGNLEWMLTQGMLRKMAG